MKHFAHYIRRSVVDPSDQFGQTEPPYAELQPPDQGFQVPAYHSVAANSGVASRVSVGDMVWLFSQLSSPWGKLMPSLDATIRVATIEKEEHAGGRYRFGAASDSKWHPLFDAIELTRELATVDAKSDVHPLLNTPRTAIGQALQFLREIADPAPLLRHAEELSETPIDFISYRIVDGTRSAFGLAKLLLEQKRAVFWDRWSLPRRLAERALVVSGGALDSHVASTIEASRIVWGVTSASYATEGSYSKLEKELASKLGKFESFSPCVNPQDTHIIPGVSHPSHSSQRMGKLRP